MSITIKDIAREAGVSISTVSKVINLSPTISQSTIQKVNDIMKKHNYYPNQRARSFAKQSTHNIVFLTTFKKDVAFANPHMFEIMCGVQKALAKKGYNLSVVSVDDEESEELMLTRMVAEKSADGVVIHGSAISPKLVPLLCSSNFPHIIIGKPNFESQLCWMDTNNYLSGEIAANHLCDIGCKSIAFVGGEVNDRISQHRQQGFETALVQKGIERKRELIKNSDSTKAGCRVVMNEILNDIIPDGVVCENNSIALGVVAAIEEKGLSIPKDIAVITFDDYPFSRIVEPMLTVVNIDVYDMGLQAGALLLRKISNSTLQIQSYTTLPLLITRGSTAR